MKILCVLGEHNYGDPSRGEGYEYVNFLPALRNLGHEIVFFESLDRSRYRDFADLNRRFLETVQTERPDIIFCVLLLYELWQETLQLVRKYSDALLVNWATDDSWKYEQFSKYVAPPFHVYATTYPDALGKAVKDEYKNFELTQWAANSGTLTEPLPAAQCRYSVSFVGSAYGNRARWIEALGRQGIPVECFGYGWKNGPVAAHEIPRIMRESIISLNFGDSGMVMRGLAPRRSRQIKARIFEVPGAGGMLLTESAEGLDRFYRVGEEIAVFEGVEDLAAKIRYFLDHPAQRDAIALKGYQRTRKEHTYEHRFSTLLDVAVTARGQRGPAFSQIDFEEYTIIERRHRVGLLLSAFRLLLLVPCVIVWGKTRGPRAARRILHELSWRLAGKKTYGVTGWPGRLFYRES